MGVETSIEVELKYAVPPGLALPDLAAAPGIASVVAQPDAQLEAVYLDTADRTLLAARIALRRRTGGHDEGWHVKLAGTGGRLELHAPIDPAHPEALPEALERVLRSRLRGRPVVPLARIRTHRRGLVVTAEGGGRVEVVDDEVRAEDVAAAAERAWREWEAERLDDDGGAALAVVDAALLAAGATHSTSPAKLAQALGGARPPAAARPRDAGGRLGALVAPLADEAHRGIAGLVLQDDPDGTAVHELRKTLRRIRSLLALRRVAGPSGAALRDGLGRLAAALGEARDPLIAAQIASALLDDLPEGAPGAATARRLLVDEGLADAQARLGGAIELLLGPDAVDVYTALATFVADGPWAARQEQVLAREAARALRQVRRRARTAHRGDLDELHRVRKSAKRVRMAEEELVAAGLLPRASRRIAARAEEVQDRLGEHRDLALLLESLPGRSIDLAAQGGNAYALGLIAAAGARRLAHLERRARRSMRRLAG